MNLPKSGILLLGVLFVCASCAAPPLPDRAPGERPALDTDEAGLWMLTDGIEQKVRTSGRIVTDSSLNAYVREIVCKLAPEQCGDIRIYVVQTPHFNATMAPNGHMQVWTGLILRAQNEAQFAYVLGHEIGHFQRRHSIQQWRTIRTTSDAMLFFQIATAAAGVGYVGDIAQLAALGGIFAYSREFEREADDIGFDLMVKAGYDPREAAKVWEALVKEKEASGEDGQFIFFSTHPDTRERIETLNTLAEQHRVNQGVDGRDRYLAATLPMRAQLLRDELRLRKFKGSQVVLDHLMQSPVGPAELHFFQGELYRLRRDAGDDENAIIAYLKSIETADTPAQAHRSLGLVYRRLGKSDEARQAFERYLQVKPDASDRQMIEAYLKPM